MLPNTHCRAGFVIGFSMRADTVISWCLGLTKYSIFCSELQIYRAGSASIHFTMTQCCRSDRHHVSNIIIPLLWPFCHQNKTETNKSQNTHTHARTHAHTHTRPPATATTTTTTTKKQPNVFMHCIRLPFLLLMPATCKQYQGNWPD